MAAPFINLMIRSKERLLFKDKVWAVTSYNAKGVFDVLAEHANFICVISQSIVVHKADKKEQVFKIDNGIMIVENDTVSMYVGVVAAIPEGAKTQL